MGQCYCYSHRDNKMGEGHGAIDLKEFISDHSRQGSLEDLVGGERDTLHIEVNNVEEEEPEDDWEAAILQRNRTDSISVKGPRSTTFRKR